jgi:Transposase and inactivated derivatives
MSSDGTGLAEALLGLDGFRVLGVAELGGDVVVLVESTAERVGCSGCGVVAEAQDRSVVEIRDLACFGRPARLRWAKRRWRCREPLCDNKTWTEESAHVSPRSVLTRRAGADACRRVGEEARPVSRLAKELGVSWSTVMDAVVEHGTPLVEDPARVGPVGQLGLDETSFLKAKPSHPTRLVTGLVDLDRRVMIDLIEGNSATDVRAWLGGRADGWLDGVYTVATDLHESYRAGLSPHLAHARRVADPFHVVGWPTVAWTRSAGGFSRRPSDTGAASGPALPDPQGPPAGRGTPRRAGQPAHAPGPAGG